MPWHPMHIETLPFAASAFPAVCACTGSHARSRRTSDILTLRFRKASGTARRSADSIRCAPRGSKTGQTALHSLRHRRRDSLARFLRLNLQLFVAVDNDARLEKDSGRSRGLENDEVVVVVHAVPAVGERLVLPRDRIGVIERRRESGMAQRLADRRGAGQASFHRCVLARYEQGKTGITVAER